MSDIDERLELLIGRFLDGEMSPDERGRLEQELEVNGRARELLDQLRTLRECGREAIAAEIDAAGGAREIFERAWQQNAGASRRRLVQAAGVWRFAVGLAAGFLLGLLVHFILVWSHGSTGTVERPPSLAGDIRPEDLLTAPRPQVTVGAPQVSRNMEWYSFTDESGGQWLVEGVREGTVKPAAYDGDL